MIDIRDAEPADGDALGEIHAAAWEAAYGQFYAPEFVASATQDRRTRWHARIAEGTGTLLLASLDGRPLALSFSLPSATRPGLAELYSFYGHPDSWGSGVAGALMTATLRRLRAGGHARVHLWTVRDTPRARRFYVKCGFAESGAVRDVDYGDGTPIAQVEYQRAC
ncbi:GNAT family N-acetyltransferase [Streptomyces huiliensis]|uniref:GNAT family N-acetyltransferase n=1 Tax=Streptomyces huiliensis TaxID=2876027 RepID=UPI001CBFEDB5|nr:GNAT family N-acetyltransferase [Streptomyces huiliensis]MBZ4319148.1 GNAT family N-acetyltransferase [Streptomyces huiliensis]